MRLRTELPQLSGKRFWLQNCKVGLKREALDVSASHLKDRSWARTLSHAFSGRCKAGQSHAFGIGNRDRNTLVSERL